jgi:hypothetical protein
MSINSNKEEGVRGEVTQLRRIAEALEEILRLVKQDQEENKKRWAEREEN